MKLLRVFRFVLLSLFISQASLQECPGTDDFLNAENLLLFENCTHVTGNVIITQSTFHGNSSQEITSEHLSLLSSIQEIDGYLLIEDADHANLTNLRFLRHLHTIHGEETLQLLGRHYSLIIDKNNYLETLNLASLRSIRSGGIRITNNPHLCLVDTVAVEEYLVDSNVRRIGGLAQDCTNVMCHEQCLMSRGCWGVLPDECIECRHYSYLGTCVEACNMSVSRVDKDSQHCLPLVVTKPPTTLHPTTTAPHTTGDGAAATDSGDHTNSDLPDATSDSSLATDMSTLMSNEDGSYVQITNIVVGPAIGVLLLLVVGIIITTALLCHRSKKSQRQNLTQDSAKNQFAERNSEEPSRVSISALATPVPARPSHEGTPNTSCDPDFTSHDSQVTPTNHTHLQTPPNHYHQRTLPNDTTHHDPLISAHINAYSSMLTAQDSKTPSPNLPRYSTGERTQQPLTMGVGGVYSTHTPSHPHRGTVSSSRRNSSRLSLSSSQHHSRTSGSAVSSMRVTASTRTSVNSLAVSLE